VEGSAPDQQRLIFAGKQLVSHWSLSIRLFQVVDDVEMELFIDWRTVALSLIIIFRKKRRFTSFLEFVVALADAECTLPGLMRLPSSRVKMELQ